MTQIYTDEINIIFGSDILGENVFFTEKSIRENP